MTELYLIIADLGLRGAITEQVKLAPLNGMVVVENDSLCAPLPSGPSAIILDAPEADEKALMLLRDFPREEKKPKLFLLGELKNEIENLVDQYSIETFTKPLRIGHLLARVQFYFQAPRSQTGPFIFGPYRLEPALRQVIIEATGATIRLTEKETQLLEYLGRADQPVPREELLAVIWGYDGRIDTHTLETHIYRLRRKLDPEGHTEGILTVQRSAYSLMAKADL